MTSEKRIAILQNTGVIDMRERNLNSELVGEIAAEIMHVSRQLVQRGVRATVSYTHLDVYKRQVRIAVETRGSVRSCGLSPIWFSLKYIGRLSLPMS